MAGRDSTGIGHRQCAAVRSGLAPALISPFRSLAANDRIDFRFLDAILLPALEPRVSPRSRMRRF